MGRGEIHSGDSAILRPNPEFAVVVRAASLGGASSHGTGATSDEHGSRLRRPMGVDPRATPVVLVDEGQTTDETDIMPTCHRKAADTGRAHEVIECRSLSERDLASGEVRPKGVDRP